jgi:hypothetical protein
MYGIVTSWVTDAVATRKARTVFNVYDTAAREFMRAEANGSNPAVGFLGATAVARQSLPADATDQATAIDLVNSIRAALINLGLCS